MRRVVAAGGVGLVVGMAIVLQPGVALAHAELQQADPPSSVTLPAAPRQVRLTYSEGVAASSAVRVSDGCGRVVSGKARAQGDQLAVPLTAGQPGAWRVDLDVVSADDGHESRESYTFAVQGAQDCSASPVSSPAAAQDGGGAALPGNGTSTGGTSTGTGALAVAALAGVGLVGVAVVVRRRTSG